MDEITFIKPNPLPDSDALECEYKGLELLRHFSSIHNLGIPTVIALTPQQLVLQHISHHNPSSIQWKAFGQKLARLHNIQGEFFGLDHDNYIGVNKQKNSASYDWGDFFFHNRLHYQVQLIKDKSLKNLLNDYFSIHKKKIIEFLNAHNPKPCLVHGDLWSGNVLFCINDQWLIDPAPYYGDFEVDIAMTKMFSDFPIEFYESYWQGRRPGRHYEKREGIYNLYHFLNHFNLFGDSYWEGIEKGLHMIDRI